MPDTLRKAVILAGGEGLRLRPLTNGIPKPMLPVLNHPFLEHTICYLKKYGITEIILALSYLPEVIKDYFGDGHRLGVHLYYTLEDNPLGTAGAVKNAEQYLDSTFAVLNGDIFTDIDIAAMYDFHRKHKARATIALTRVDNPCAFGVVETDKSGRIRRFMEKPAPEEVTSNWINAGVYLIEPEVLQQVPQNTNYMFERGLFPRLLESGETVCGYRCHGQWLDMGTPEKYLCLNRDLLLSRNKPSLIGSPRENGLYCAEDTVIDPSVQISGPVVIARQSRIGQRVYLKGPVVVDAGCVIGDGVVIEEAVLWHGVRIGEGAVLRRCVVGNDNEIGGGEQVIDRVVPPYGAESIGQ
jgi:mannose-1-phosphate guanylyltransferase